MNHAGSRACISPMTFIPSSTLDSAAIDGTGRLRNGSVLHVVEESDGLASHSTFCVATIITIFVGIPLGGIM